MPLPIIPIAAAMAVRKMGNKPRKKRTRRRSPTLRVMVVGILIGIFAGWYIRGARNRIAHDVPFAQYIIGVDEDAPKQSKWERFKGWVSDKMTPSSNTQASPVPQASKKQEPQTQPATSGFHPIKWAKARFTGAPSTTQVAEK